VVDQYLGLHYPLVMFFHVGKENEPLKQALTLGLERAHADGSFSQLIRTHPFMQPILTRTDLKSRRWFDVENPLFSQEEFLAAQKYFDSSLLEGIR
jgi:hypothetical protein